MERNDYYMYTVITPEKTITAIQVCEYGTTGFDVQKVSDFVGEGLDKITITFFRPLPEKEAISMAESIGKLEELVGMEHNGGSIELTSRVWNTPEYTKCNTELTEKLLAELGDEEELFDEPDLIP